MSTNSTVRFPRRTSRLLGRCLKHLGRTPAATPPPPPARPAPPAIGRSAITGLTIARPAGDHALSDRFVRAAHKTAWVRCADGSYTVAMKAA